MEQEIDLQKVIRSKKLKKMDSGGIAQYEKLKSLLAQKFGNAT